MNERHEARMPAYAKRVRASMHGAGGPLSLPQWKGILDFQHKKRIEKYGNCSCSMHAILRAWEHAAIVRRNEAVNLLRGVMRGDPVEIERAKAFIEGE